MVNGIDPGQSLALYARSADPSLDEELFRNPPSIYRGAPFWAWNTRLDRDQLLRQLRILRQMGFGGAHVHVRTGMATPYLGDEFMDLVRSCTDQARADGMLIWLYDEDRWPSGFAGGLVTKHKEYRAKHLLFTTTAYGGKVEAPSFDSNSLASRHENGTLLARYQVVLEGDRLTSYRRLLPGEPLPGEAVGGRIWYAYLETAETSPWWNNQTYVDTLDPASIACFLAVTHERYAEATGAEFGKTIPAIFTDEPQFIHKVVPQWAGDTRDLFLPWTTGFVDGFRAAYGDDPLDTLPEVFWELPDSRPSRPRYRYHEYLAERFASTFAGQVGAWCDAHGLRLTGHLMEEPTLRSQTSALGEAMRPLRSFHIPGIDMLCDWHEYTTAKQAQSVAHQYGRPGVLSELYGVTNWDFDFVGHKAQGDWQAALGVTVRVPHLSWVSMAGEAKRDYPASISYQSPWYGEYPLVENHFARLNTVLTRGRPRVRVGVIHPIESYWLAFGPLEQTGVERSERESQFANLTEWLLFGLIDFDFIAESLLSELSPLDGAPDPRLAVGTMAYDVVVVPGLRTIRAGTLDRLERFADAGGAVLFVGDVPSLVDAVPSDRPRMLAARCRRAPFSRAGMLEALAPVKEIDARLSDGTTAATLLHQLREDGDRRSLFLCNTDKRHGYDVVLTIQGRWRPVRLETLDGSIHAMPSRLVNGATRLSWHATAHGSLLLQLLPVAEPAAMHAEEQEEHVTWTVLRRLDDPVPIVCSEPNVLLLDSASYRLDDGAWRGEEEVLRIDNILRAELGYPLKMDAVAQPWTQPPAVTPHTVGLRFRIQTGVAVSAPLLALEDAGAVGIRLDGAPVECRITGWWVDEAIATRALPDLAPGLHELALEVPYGSQSNLEWCYLLGNFGVRVHGRHARLVEPPRELAFGDWTGQGLPFFAGNVTYRCRFDSPGGRLAVRVPDFKAPVLAVELDGIRVGPLAFDPFRVDLGLVAPGLHEVGLTAYGNRVNAFGPVHNANLELTWFGPNGWRTTGDDWAYEYQLKPMGILSAPRLEQYVAVGEPGPRMD